MEKTGQALSPIFLAVRLSFGLCALADRCPANDLTSGALVARVAFLCLGLRA